MEIQKAGQNLLTAATREEKLETGIIKNIFLCVHFHTVTNVKDRYTLLEFSLSEKIQEHFKNKVIATY